ncbi:MAG: Transcriptional regulator, IclR family [uncultured Rubrobacteraceae bacterium]|uniref:Glycerol operon regulatory protein n=1 Tax=uncultured Rubrobacteraceae bacterium TaxID=349277 RepID=A0A6J4RNY2_9ACTN|nr:MAG: Transcriptional regulator, IclR family [uncultured Rubrobacteraceae bacterium]
MERALDILEMLGHSEGELGISEIGLSVGLANGTVHRLLSTLTRRGYARQVSDSRKYTLGPRAITLASSSRERLGPLARPFLQELMEVSQESANLAALDRNSVVYIEQVPAPRMVRMFTEPGNRVPPHASGTGKVLLAFQPPEAVQAVLGRSGLARFTQHTVTDMDRLLGELEVIREQGYATDSEEIEEGVRCVAAPVSGAEGRVVAAISVSGPAGRLGGERLEEIIPQIKRIAADLSYSLSGPAS